MTAVGPAVQAPAPTAAVETAVEADLEIDVADEYDDMAAFWAALDRQERGASVGSIWDPYESGERRAAELQLAALFGAPDAALVASGMLAIVVALLAQAELSGLALAPPADGAYFENQLLLETLRGLVGGPPAVAAERVEQVELLELVGNSAAFTLATDLGPRRAAVVDNSLFSLSIPYSELRQVAGAECVVVESVPKYLVRSVPAGVVYGPEREVAHVRALARRLGALLSRRAAATISAQLPGAASLGDALRRHAANAEVLAAELAPWLDGHHHLVLPHLVARRAGFAGACASIVAVRPATGVDPGLLRDAFGRWSAGERTRRGRGLVRAGYGWPVTYGRWYEANVLNTAAGDCYLRLSVGLEPVDEIRSLARGLGAALHPGDGGGCHP
jgi:cystathionine beta-lyase/cystathionine gamma-synthase